MHKTLTDFHQAKPRTLRKAILKGIGAQIKRINEDNWKLQNRSMIGR